MPTQTGPELVHYTPILTTILSAVFVVMLLARARQRTWAPHLIWWAIGIFFYGLGTAVESSITLWGNTEMLNRLWYWAGAILGGYPLATGSLYLLGKTRLAHVCTAISLAFVILASVLVFIGPMKEGMIEASPHRPIGRGIWEWQWLPWLTPFINIYALFWLVGGALVSSVGFFLASQSSGDICRKCGGLLEGEAGGACASCGSDLGKTRVTAKEIRGELRNRAAGTALIALGGLLPGIGGAMTKAGYVEWLYVGEFLGLVLIILGYAVCVRVPSLRAAPAVAEA